MPDKWPALPYAEFAATRTTFHMVAQMVGKVRLALAPPQPEWLNACLYLTARGFTTGAMPYGRLAVTIGIDVFDAVVRIEVSDGRRTTLPLGPNRTVAELWADFLAALAGLSIEVDLWDKPQEVVDTTPFHENTRDGAFNAEQAQRFHRVVSAVNDAFEEFRSPFFGRTGVQFWWGGFDFCVVLYTGRQVAAPDDRGIIARFDLDAEHMTAGFWLGDDDMPEAQFFAYLVPAPDGCADASVEPSQAAWDSSMGEWILPYEDVRASADPRAMIIAFLKSVYQVAVTKGGWDAQAFRYEAPALRPRRRRR